ncbi:glutamyl-tRNA reductase [Aridibaculum aurantiacum]|uniref:glutamyl-tRNA reductase n=1 Tax=Aridibaculum aurantiacum TaxID=2810307 RepID=UPI001A970F23|nr:glutamyl-tRNA reductase [Aridibaculum aurantiacum]
MSAAHSISQFFIAGINYKKTDASIRGQFAINSDQYKKILAIASSRNMAEFFILSTCNRTEIYGFAEDATKLVELLCSETEGSLDTFNKLCYIKQGQHAVQHLFEVGAGLESQILGDYEIIGQIKQAVKFAKQNGFVGAFLERLVNSVIASTKEIKNQTALSGGTVSVSFAAVQYIKKHVTDIQNKKIVLLGIGKIGRNTCKNIVDYLNTTNVTLINRTEEKAALLASEIGVKHAPFWKLSQELHSADIILVATNAAEPTILKTHVEGQGEKLIIDLSIPYNVERAAQELKNVTLVNVDELSKLKDETLKKRVKEVPKAKNILSAHMQEFIDWSDMRKHAPALKALKLKLNNMQNCELYTSCHHTYPAVTTTTAIVASQEYAIKKVLSTTAVKMRQTNQPGCTFIEAINDFITHRN